MMREVKDAEDADDTDDAELVATRTVFKATGEADKMLSMSKFEEVEEEEEEKER